MRTSAAKSSRCSGGTPMACACARTSRATVRNGTYRPASALRRRRDRSPGIGRERTVQPVTKALATTSGALAVSWTATCAPRERPTTWTLRPTRFLITSATILAANSIVNGPTLALCPWSGRSTRSERYSGSNSATARHDQPLRPPPGRKAMVPRLADVTCRSSPNSAAVGTRVFSSAHRLFPTRSCRPCAASSAACGRREPASPRTDTR